MTSPPDKTFRDKLLDYQKPAPPEAWDRIEKGLEGSGSKGIWFKVAAAVMVLAIPLFILWPKTQDESIAVTNSKHVVDEPDVAEEKSENILQAIEENIVHPSKTNNSEVITLMVSWTCLYSSQIIFYWISGFNYRCQFTYSSN